MSLNTIAAEAAYLSIEGGETSRRTPWRDLSPHWHDYWGKIAQSVINVADEKAVPELTAALNAMLTHSGMDEDEWNKPTFDQARAAIRKWRP